MKTKKIIVFVSIGIVLLIGITLGVKCFYNSKEKVVVSESEKPSWRTEMQITNKKYISYTDKYDIIRNTDELGGNSKKYYSKYLDYVAPNGKTIHLLAQDKVTDSQMLYAYSILNFYLFHLKDDVANQMADNEAVLVMPNGSDGDGKTSENALIGQPQYQNETANIGSKWYMESDYNHRDSSYEEIFHLVHGFGIGMIGDKSMTGGDYELAKKIYKAQTNAVPKDRKKWGKQGLWLLGVDNEDLEEWENEPGTLEAEYIICVIDTYYGNWEAFDGNGALFDEYIAKTRRELKQKDSVGYKTLTSFLPEFIDTFMPVDEDFKGTFDMNYNKSKSYTFKSQYLKNIILQGKNNANIIGNDQDNIFMGNAGINKIDGGKGKNIAQLRGAFSEYTITTDDGVVTIKDNIDNRDGQIILNNIKILRFIDKDLAI